MAHPALLLDQVTVRLPDVEILKDVSWKLPRGARAALLGPNGCGKSTLLRTITGYGHVTAGRVEVLGERIGATNLLELRRRLGILDPRLARLVDPRISALQLVATGFFASLTAFYDTPTSAQQEAAQQALEEVGLAGRSEQRFQTLSSGQQTRTWLARALVHQPELLILDEPTAELDLLARETFLATLARLLARRPDVTLIMVTHHLEDLLPDTDQMLLLADGRVVAAGSPEESLNSHSVSQTFACPVTVSRQHGRWTWSVSPQVWQRLID